jgi:SsrA-binding protein
MSDIVQNRKARHDYEILETFEVGISLLGTEIKAIRETGASLQESYIAVKKSEVWLKLAYIAPYSFGNINNHEERRDRKLLLHKAEIAKLKKGMEQKGLTIVPLSMYYKKGRVKLKIALAKGKQAHDKRSTVKERDVKREMDRAMKS